MHKGTELTGKIGHVNKEVTLKEAIKNFVKEIKDLEKSGVEFSTVVVDSYDNIKFSRKSN